jgi:hypothetical protein
MNLIVLILKIKYLDSEIEGVVMQVEFKKTNPRRRRVSLGQRKHNQSILSNKRRIIIEGQGRNRKR